MSRKRVLAVCAIVCAAGCGGQAPAPGRAATASRGSPSTSSTPMVTTQWPERRIRPEDAVLQDASQVLDPAAGVLYALVPPTLESGTGPYTLQAIDLHTGRVRRGTSYPVSGLALASGYLWVFGSSGRPVLDEVDPRTLAGIRSLPVSATTAVAPGPAGSVWVGTARMLLRVSARTGAVLARVALPAGLELSDLAARPGDGNLYASAWRQRPGGIAVLAYSAGSGTLLARSDRAPLTWSAGWADLTAVPGGVWVWFRTGMLGESVLLSGRSLSAVAPDPAAPAVPATAVTSPVTGYGTIYSWPSDSTSAYAGGALWVATAGGLLACVNPATGTVRAQEVAKSLQANPVITVAADPPAHQLAVVISTIGVATITPPRSCWT
jgi:hypothetical protein